MNDVKRAANETRNNYNTLNSQVNEKYSLLTSKITENYNNLDDRLRSSIQANEATTSGLSTQLSMGQSERNRFSTRMTYFEERNEKLSDSLLDVSGKLALRLHQLDEQTDNLNQTHIRLVRSVDENNSAMSDQLTTIMTAITDNNRDCNQRNQNLTEQLHVQSQEMMEMAQNLTQLQAELDFEKQKAIDREQRFLELQNKFNRLFFDRDCGGENTDA